jgi:hypothetical protein
LNLTKISQSPPRKREPTLAVLGLRRPATAPLRRTAPARCGFAGAGSGTLAVRHLLNFAISRRRSLRRPASSSTGASAGGAGGSFRFAFLCLLGYWSAVFRHLGRSPPPPLLAIRTKRHGFRLDRRGRLLGPPSATLRAFRVVVARPLSLPKNRNSKQDFELEFKNSEH